MKVLMFGWEFPPNISGGLGTASYGLARGLVENDIDLSFVVPKAYGNEPEEGFKLISASNSGITYVDPVTGKRVKGLEEIRSGSSVSAYISPEEYSRIKKTPGGRSAGKFNDPEIKGHKFSGHYGNTLFDEVSWYAAAGGRIAAMIPHDVIHAHDWLTYPAGISAREYSGRPLVVHVHATEFDRSGENTNRHVFEIEKWGMSEADKVITVSNFTRNTVIERYKIDPAKVVTVYNAPEPGNTEDAGNKNRNPGRDHIVTFLGRITWQKGPEYFLNAASRVLQKMNDTRFIMAGTGDMLEKMIRYAARLKIAGRVHFTGFLRGEDVHRVFSLSDLYVMPSVSEPFGISPLEAIRQNVPVIISRQSGVSEVLRHAIKVDFWDVDALADSIYGVLNYPSLANHLRDYSKSEITRLSWTDSGAGVKSVYNQVLKMTG